MTLLSTLSHLDPASIAKNCIQNGSESDSKVQISQIQHRLDIIRSWLEINQEKGNQPEKDFDLESHLLSGVNLDVGCGQGDFIAAMAAALLQVEKKGENRPSKIVGIDPARLDYGSPFTLKQAQDHLSSSPLGPKLEFQQATLEGYLGSNPSSDYSTLFLVHSIYYLSSPSLVVLILSSARKAGVKSLCLAEWSLKSSLSSNEALSHILAVLLQSLSPLEEGNVRTVFTPTSIVECARKAGWELVGEKFITPRRELSDGGWEVYAAREVAEKNLESDQAKVGSGQERNEESLRKDSLRAHLFALESSIPNGNVKEVRSMDVWCGLFKPLN